MYLRDLQEAIIEEAKKVIKEDVLLKMKSSYKGLNFKMVDYLVLNISEADSVDSYAEFIYDDLVDNNILKRNKTSINLLEKATNSMREELLKVYVVNNLIQTLECDGSMLKLRRNAVSLFDDKDTLGSCNLQQMAKAFMNDTFALMEASSDSCKAIDICDIENIHIEKLSEFFSIAI